MQKSNLPLGVGEQCGRCVYWLKDPPQPNPVIGAPVTGTCWGAPPQVIPLVDKGTVVGGMNIRPHTRQDEPACGFWDDGEGDEMEAANEAAH